jgi:uncharacterized protein (DUF1330 family)
MSAFLIFHSTVRDPEKFQIYVSSVPATLKPFGGSLLTRGKSAKVLSGQHKHPTVGILKFSDLNQAHGWYESEAYQALISNRDAAAEMTIVSYEEPENPS